MNDTTALASNQARLSNRAMSYFKGRLRAISADVAVIENAHREGMLGRDEFLTIRRSLMGAKREVQAALDSITSVDGASVTPSSR